MDTYNALETVTDDINTSTKQRAEAKAELNEAINTVAECVEDIAKVRPTLKRGMNYESVLSDKWQLFAHLSLLISYFASGITIFTNLANGAFMSNITVNAFAFILVALLQFWFSATHVNVFNLQRKIEAKGKLSAFRLLSMRIFTTKRQWEKFSEANLEAQKYNEANNAWVHYQKEVTSGEKFKNAQKIINDNSPRREIYLNELGRVDCYWKESATKTVTEANIRKWIAS